MPNNTIERFYNSRAIYSDCGRYRYFLSHTWDIEAPVLMFIMLNPSKATESKSDGTVTWCKRRTEQEEIYGGFCVLNIFAKLGTNPRVLRQPGDHIGPCNDEIIRRQVGAIRDIDMIVCAWGNDGAISGRGNRVEDILRETTDSPLYCLDTSDQHHPMHPRGIHYRYDKEFELFAVRATRIG